MLYLFNHYIVLLMIQLPMNILQFNVSRCIIVYKDIGIIFFSVFTICKAYKVE